MVLVVYDPIYPEEADGVEKNVRLCLPDWCESAEFTPWRYDPQTRCLSTAVETACPDPDQITTGLMYAAWDALDHYCKVVMFLDPLVWEHPFHGGDEAEYQVYIEETRLEAELFEIEEWVEEGRISQARAQLSSYLAAATAQHERGAPWSEQLLAYYRKALRDFERRHGPPEPTSQPRLREP